MVFNGKKSTKDRLLFADDNLLFARANPNEAAAIMKVLESYQASSGQVVSPDKFEGSYSRSVPNYYEYMTCQQINIMAVTSLCRHMSPLLVFRRSKKDFFSFLKERVWKVKWWKKNPIIGGQGKAALIKLVARAIPNYIMSCYKLP